MYSIYYMTDQINLAAITLLFASNLLNFFVQALSLVALTRRQAS